MSLKRHALLGFLCGLAGALTFFLGSEALAHTAEYDKSRSCRGWSINGHAHQDIIIGSTVCARNDRFTGAGGPDDLWGNLGADNLSGGYGSDLIFGGPGDDLLIGGAGHDFLRGGPGFDVCLGGAGVDTIVGCEAIGDIR